MRDFINNIQTVHLGALTLSGTTPAVSAYADVKGFQGATIVVAPASITDAGTAAGFTATLQESADTTAAAAATVATDECVNAVNTVTVTSDDADNSIAGALGYLGSERYVGVSVVGTTGTSATVNVYAIMGKPHVAPTTFVGTAVART